MTHQADFVFVDLDISIHTPLAGSDARPGTVIVASNRFQSTLPLRGVTYARATNALYMSISIHTPLAGSDQIKSSTITPDKFQSTLPLRGVTRIRPVGDSIQLVQSTLPLRGVTAGTYLKFMDKVFQSTLPLRGVTGMACTRFHSLIYFNAHSPCGE